MLTIYDECQAAVVVFNQYGDIVYRNPKADKLITSNQVGQIAHSKIRVMAQSLILGLTLPPLTFHASSQTKQPTLCHIVQCHNSYTLLLAPRTDDLPLKPHLSKLKSSFPQKSCEYNK